MEQPPRRNGRIVKYGVLVLSVAIVCVALVALRNWEKNNGQYTAEQEESSFVEHQGERYALREDIDTLLVIGLDNEDLPIEKKRVETLLLLVFDNDRKTSAAININPRTVTQVNTLNEAGESILQPIADAYTYGGGGKVGCRNVADAVSALLSDVKVHRYVALPTDMAAPLIEMKGSDWENVSIDTLADLMRDAISDSSVIRLQSLAHRFYTYDFNGTFAVEGSLTDTGEAIEFHPDTAAVTALVLEQFYARCDE